jgi:hypothetical protein
MKVGVAAYHRVVLGRCQEVVLSGYHEGGCGYIAMGVVVADFHGNNCG